MVLGGISRPFGFSLVYLRCHLDFVMLCVYNFVSCVALLLFEDTGLKINSQRGFLEITVFISECLDALPVKYFKMEPLKLPNLVLCDRMSYSCKNLSLIRKKSETNVVCLP